MRTRKQDVANFTVNHAILLSVAERTIYPLIALVKMHNWYTGHMSTEGGNVNRTVNPEYANTIETRQQLEKLRKERAVVFVPGLAEASPIFDSLVTSLEEVSKERGTEPQEYNAAMQSARLYVVSTHDDVASKYQQKISEKVTKDMWKQGKGAAKEVPIMGVISDSEKHHDSFENRVQLVLQGAREAMTDETEELTIVGHSAGAAATLAAVAQIVAETKENKTRLPKIHLILLAPAIPGEARKMIPVAAPFLRVMLRNLFTQPFSQTYLKHLFAHEDIHMNDEDILNLFGPLKSKKFAAKILASKVPTAGKEGNTLMQWPRVFGDLKPGDWPENLTIDVVIPDDDRLVSTSAQYALVNNVLKEQLGGRVEGFSVSGGHLEPLENKETARVVAERIFKP